MYCMGRHMAEHNEVGAYGEQLVAGLLRTVGCVKPGRTADLCFEGIDVEVKTARLSAYNGRDRGYQFCLEREGHTHVRAAVVVLVCMPEARCVVIPAIEVVGVRKIGLPEQLEGYAGRWAPFVEAWEVLADAAEAAEVSRGTAVGGAAGGEIRVAAATTRGVCVSEDVYASVTGGGCIARDVGSGGMHSGCDTGGEKGRRDGERDSGHVNS